MTELYAAESVLLRVQKLAQTKSHDEIANQINIMKVLFNDANDNPRKTWRLLNDLVNKSRKPKKKGVGDFKVGGFHNRKSFKIS